MSFYLLAVQSSSYSTPFSVVIEGLEPAEWLVAQLQESGATGLTVLYSSEITMNQYLSLRESLKTSEKRLDDTMRKAFHVYYEEYLNEDEIEHSEKNLKSAWTFWLQAYHSEFHNDHLGDCSKAKFTGPITCMRCVCDRLLKQVSDVDCFLEKMSNLKI